MASKLEYYSRMAEDTADGLTQSREQWTAFLRTAGRVSKYAYGDQLMIFAQRPEATACAEYDLWNNTMRRYVKRGSKGIALIDNSGDYPRLRYVFDVADTGARRNSRPVNLWQMREEYERPVQEALAAVFEVSARDPLDVQVENIANWLAIDYWMEHEYELADIVADSFLEEYDENSRRMSFLNAATVSIKYEILSRCVENPDDYFEPDEFTPVFDYNTRKATNALGTAVSEISGQVIREIEVTIRNYERSKRMERSHDYGIDLHAERGLSDPQPHPQGDQQGTPGQVRTDAPDVLAGASPDPVQRPVPDGAAVPPSSGDRRDSAQPVGAVDAGTAGEEPRPGQVDTADGLGTTHEQPESAGGGDRADGAGVQLTEEAPEPVYEQMTLSFPTEAEQIAQIDHEAESETPSAFSLPQEDIDHVLRLGGRTEQTRMEVAALFMTGKSPIEIANFLSREYRGGLGLLTDNGRMSAWFGEQGIWLASGDHARDAAPGMYIPWLNAAERIGVLMDAGQFATNVELAESRGYFRTQLAQSLWYLRQDFSEMADEMSLMSSLDSYRGGGFPQDTAQLANALADPEARAAITQDMETFAQVYEQERGILRFHHLNIPAMVNGLHDLAAPWKEYTSDMAAVPGARQFITEDELDEAISYGSMMAGGKERIHVFFSEPHTTREQAAFLREEYGIGGHSGPFSNKRHSSEQHDSKGIKLEKDGCATVTLTWNAVAKRVTALIKADRYLTEEEKAQIQQEREPAEPVPEMPVAEPSIAGDVPPVAEAEPEEDDFSDIDPERVRERLAEHGIVNGEVVDPDKLAQSPFIRQVEADVERIAAEETAEEEAPILPEANAEAVSPEDTPEDRFHVIEVDWYPGRVAYSIWDDQTDNYYENKDGLTVDFVSRWQAEEYRNELVESAQRETMLSPLDKAKDLIDEYCLEEFSEGADFTDLTTIGVAFTTITDDEIPIQAYVDLVGFKLERYLGETLIDVRQYDSLEALIAGELEELSFDDLTYASDEQIAAVLAQEAEQADVPLAEQAEQFETEQQDYRNQVLSGLTPDQQRIVMAMETAGYLFRPTETNPIYFGDLDVFVK